MAGTVRRGGQIAWAGLKLGVAVLRLRRRALDLLPAYVSTTLVGLEHPERAEIVIRKL